VEQYHPKDVLTLEEFLALRQQVVTKPTEPLTVADSTDNDDRADAAAAQDLANEPPPGVDDQPPGTDDQLGSDTASSDNKSKVYNYIFFYIFIVR